MDKLLFISSNKGKIERASHFLTPLSISFDPYRLDLEEIQSESIAEIAEHKAKHAFSVLNKPLFVSDHGWFITALNGFPGAYMRYMNKWLTPQDFLNLMKDKSNREMYFEEVICYTDGEITKVFSQRHKGHVLYEAKGNAEPWMTVSSFSEDNQSIAEAVATKPNALSNEEVWQELATFLTSLK